MLRLPSTLHIARRSLSVSSGTICRNLRIATTATRLHTAPHPIRRLSSTPVRGAWYKNGDTETFERVTSKENTSDKVVLVDFFAEMLSPILEELTADSPEPTRTGSGRTLDLLTVDIDEQRELATSYQVRSIPLVVAFKDGVEAKRFVGAKRKEEILEFLKEL